MNLLEEAIIYSTIMHQGKLRKINNSPYILHPLEVAQILSGMTDDMEIIAAGVLHDIVEDTDGTLKEIEKRFGKRVAVLVDSETEKEYAGEDRAATWKRRKEESLEKLKTGTDIGVKMLWLADKLSNMRSLAGSYGEMGEKIWEHLHQKDPEIHKWYYKTIAEYVEMELNKTGAYKEYIDRINYIWPGTFDTSKTKYKEYREIDVSGCTRIGRGAKAEVYRYDEELIVKVYNEKNTYNDVEREIALARSVFVLGLPTAISFGIVSVGKGYGSMFELIDAKTVSEIIAKNPEHTDYCAGVMAELALQIHSTRPDNGKLFPQASAYIESWIRRAKLDEDTEKKLSEIIASRPVSECLVHGDLHTGNVFLSNNEPLFIDVDRMAVGDPIVDLSSMYLFYIGYAELDPKIIEDFMGFSVQTASAFYHSFIRQYLKTDDEAEIGKAVRSSSLWAFVRLIGQIKKKPLSDKDKAAVEKLTEKVQSLID
ncbi:MAG: HD domain-containing protein [Ruminiclostridium sp.]|nr:HD domain-containing protein [Ruminiclostridium sp.]